MSDQIASIGTLGGLIVSIVALVISIRRGIRSDKAARLAKADEERKQAIEEAKRPLLDDNARLLARAELAEHRCDEISRSTEQVVDQATSIWRERVADREHEIANLKEERDYYRDQPRGGVDLKKPEDRP